MHPRTLVHMHTTHTNDDTLEPQMKLQIDDNKLHNARVISDIAIFNLFFKIL